jgi:hypothetical protein
MKKIFLVGLMLVVVVALTGCAAGPNVHRNQPNPDGEIAGFWQGLWQGFISGFTFIISLFNDNVSVYEVHNNGGWYNFGFMIGVSSFFGGSGRGTRRSRWKSEA